MSKSIKLHTTNGMIRDVRLGKLKVIAPNRTFIVEKSKDKYNRLQIKFNRIKLMINDNEKLEELSNLSRIIASKIKDDRKVKGAFSETGINLYDGSTFIYSFDLEGNKLVDNHKLIKELYNDRW